MALYLDYPLLDEIFSKLKKYFEETTHFENYTIFSFENRHFKNLKETIEIKYRLSTEDEHEHNYAKSLLKIYNENVKPLLNRSNSTIVQIPEPFSRLYFLNEKPTIRICGKTIHHSQNTQ
jgi:hypothetical protein